MKQNNDKEYTQYTSIQSINLPNKNQDEYTINNRMDQISVKTGNEMRDEQ